MKKLKSLFLLLIVALTSVAFVSCGDDKDEPGIGNASIVGIWEVPDVRVNGHNATLQAEFGSNNRGSLRAIYSDGTDTDSYNFEYVLKTDREGDEYLSIIWTGTDRLIYDGDTEYYITITPTRLVWGDYTYTRK